MREERRSNFMTIMINAELCQCILFRKQLKKYCCIPVRLDNYFDYECAKFVLLGLRIHDLISLLPFCCAPAQLIVPFVFV